MSIPTQTISGNTTTMFDTKAESAEVQAKIEGISYTSNNKCGGVIGKEGKNAKYEGNVRRKG